MVKTPTSYDRPREKIQHNGVATLSDEELLQALIGSGNAQANVARIARRTMKLFKKYGSNIEYNQLKEVSGLGPARISLIVAALELARRFLLPATKLIVRTDEELIELIEPLRRGSQPMFVYVLLDGAYRLIDQQSTPLTKVTPLFIRKLLREAVRHQAVHVDLIFIRPDGTLIPTLEELSLTRTVRQSASILSISVPKTILVNAKEYHSILASVV